VTASRATIYDVFRNPEDHSLRRLPGLVRDAFSMVWRSAPRELAWAIALQVVSAVGLVAQLLVGRHVLETILTADQLDRSASSVVPGLVVLLGVTAVLHFAGAARNHLQTLLTELTARHAQGRILDVATAVDLEAFENPEFHDRLQRAQVGAGSRPWMMTSSIVNLVGAVVGMVGLVVALAVIQPILLPLVLLAYVPAFVAASRNSRYAYRFAHGMTPNDRLRFNLSYVLSGKPHAAEVRAFQLAPFLRRHYDDLYQARVDELRVNVRQRLRQSLVASVATSLLSAVTIGVLVALLLADRIDVAGAAAAAVAIQQLNGRLSGIVYNATTLYESALFLADFSSFLDLLPEVEGRRPDGAAPAGFSRLVVDHLTFAYPGCDRLALDDVSLDIRAGEVVALVGENGSGKTTLAKLLCNLYAPTSGRILWDGVDVAGCDPALLGRHVAVIFQDFVQYFMAARVNIAVGDHERAGDLEAVVAAAVASGADPFLAGLPEGYETMLGRQFDGGHELSIGQWQRVALARAFFRAAPLLILDEPTAALDPRAEHELFERMRALAAGRTVLLISHRFSSVRSADRIFVLRQGRLEEQGSHADLMAAGGLYAELFGLQASAYEEAVRPAR
jgi:ATP-binding cassette subfamily B protein